MCLINYIKENEKYKHLTYAERTMIERWHNKEQKTNKEIGLLLNKSERTIRREIKRGRTINLTTEYEYIYVYSADIAEEKYRYNLDAKGPDLKIGKNKQIANLIKHKIKEEKKSPEVISYELKQENVIISNVTIRNYIKKEIILELTSKDLTYNKNYKNKNKEKRIAKHTPPEKSIEKRPKEANDRSEYGHWEGDLVIGTRKKGSVLLTFTERMTREEIIIKIKGKNDKYVVQALNILERKYKSKFYNKFKTITFDNGIEFMDYKGMEKSCLRKGKRTNIYYAHPYCSGERGTNENNNRMIRRWIPKGISIDEISKDYIQKIEDWINNYPRAMFDYKSSNMILLSK